MANLPYIGNITEPNNTTTKYRFFFHESLSEIASTLGFTAEDAANPATDAKKPPIRFLINENSLRKIRLGYKDANKKFHYRSVYCIGANVTAALSGVIHKTVGGAEGVTHTIVTAGIKTHTRLG